MSTKRTMKTSDQGSVMLPALMMTGVLAVCATGLSGMMHAELHGVRKIALVADVNFIAEAGANHGLAVCKASNALPPSGLIEVSDFALGGTYEVSFERLETGAYRISSVGTKGDYSVAVNILYRPGDDNPLAAFEYGLFADQNIDVNGIGDFSSDAHANQNADVGNLTLHGDLSAAGAATGPNVTGDVVSGSPIIPWPTIDWGHYYDLAASDGSAPGGSIANGTHENGIFSSSIVVGGSGTIVLEPTNGVVWVEGDVTFNGRRNLIVHGTLIATGLIRFNARSTLTQTGVGDALAVASRDSGLLFNGSGTMATEGLLIANGGNFRRNGTVPSSVTGAIMAKGDIIINGGIDGMVHTPYSPPDTAEDELGNIMDVLAWYKSYPRESGWEVTEAPAGEEANEQ